MKRFFSRIFSSFATFLLATLIIAWIVNVTILSSSYLVAKADQTGLFIALSKQLPALAFPGNSSESLRLQAELTRELGPTAVRREFSTFLSGIEGYIREGGSLPKPPFEATINSLGATSEVGQSPMQPIKSPVLVSARTWFVLISGWFLRIAGLALLFAFLAIAVFPSKALSTAIRMVVTVLLSLALSYLGFRSLPALVAGRMQLGPELAPILPIIKSWLIAVVAGMNKLIIESGAVLLAVFVVLAVTAFMLRRQKRTAVIKDIDTKQYGRSDSF